MKHPSDTFRLVLGSGGSALCLHALRASPGAWPRGLDWNGRRDMDDERGPVHLCRRHSAQEFQDSHRTASRAKCSRWTGSRRTVAPSATAPSCTWMAGTGIPRRRMLRDAIVAANRQPDHRDPAQLRSRCMDQARPADRSKERTRFGDFRTTGRQPPLQPPAGIREEVGRTYMSTANQITANELTQPTNRRKFLSYLGAAPTLTAFAGAGLFSSPSALADTGPLNASERRHRAFVVRRDAAIYQRDAPEPTSIRTATRNATQTASRVTARVCRTTTWARWT